ncbi:MAG: AsmA family protein, partial [Gammaproteobacteria bacterium]
LGRVSGRNFVVDINFDADLATGNIDIPVMSLSALGIEVDGNLAAKDMQQSNGSVNGQLNVSGDSLKEILAALEYADLAEVVQSINLNAGINGSRNDLNISPVDLRMVLAGATIPNSPVTLGLAANTRLNLERETLSLDEFSLSGLGLNLTGKLSGSNIFESPAFNGEINIPAFNLRRFAQQLNKELPDTADSKVFEKVSLSTAFEGSANHMNISKLAMVLDDSNLNGTWSVTDFEQPAIEFDIDIDQINADRYLPPTPAEDQVRPVTPETAVGAAAQLPVETLRSLNSRGQLNIGQLTISGARLTDLALALDAKDGLINLSPVTANLYQGQYQGEIKLDATGELPELAIKSGLQGVNIDPLMMDFMGKSSASGNGNVEFSLTARGADTEAFKQTLN